MTIAALYVQADGCYANLAGVDPWPEARDARLYAGPWPVVAHPECKRWGRFWHGSPSKPHQFKLGDDGGQFAAALASVRQWGGILEHPEGSQAWAAYGLAAPPREGGWIRADWPAHDGWTCCVEQGAYGHKGRKATWLYGCAVNLPELAWGSAPGDFRRPVDSANPKARVRGEVERMSKRQRSATPIPFRDLLLSIARTASREVAAA